VRGSVLVAFIAATPPTLAAMLAFFSTRASARVATLERTATVAQSLDNLRTAVDRIESAVDLVNHDHLHTTGLNVTKKSGQVGTVCLGARHAVLFEVVTAELPPPVTDE